MSGRTALAPATPRVSGRVWTWAITAVLAATLAALTVPPLLRPAVRATPAVIPFRDLTGSLTAAPLTILEYAYARGVSPVAGAGVPDGGIPVGMTGGHDSSRAFVRLAGQARVLRLALDADRSATVGADRARLEMCPVLTEEWRAVHGMALGQGPAYDCTRSAPGVRLTDGTWAFDLAAFTARAGSKGFAIVPVPASAGGDDSRGDSFQVTFSTQRLGPPR